MVLTRSSEKNRTPTRSPRNQEYWRIKKKLSARMLRVKKKPESSSSSSSDISDSESKDSQNEPSSESILSKRETRPSSEHTSTNSKSLQSNLSVDHQNASSCMNDSDESSSSETQVLIQAGRRTLETNPINNTIIRRELPFRKARHSIGLTGDENQVEKILENESEWSFSDESSSTYASSESTVTVNQFKSLLEQKLIRKKCESKGDLKKKSSIYSSSDSEVEISRNNSRIETTGKRKMPDRIIRTPEKYQEFLLNSNSPSKTTSEKENSADNIISNDVIINQSNSVQRETNEEDCNNTPVKRTPSTNNIQIKSFEIRLTRTHYVSPERSSAEKQPKDGEIKNINASTSNTIKANVQKENRGKIAVCHQDIEDLLRQLHGSSDSEVEKTKDKSPEKIKQQTPVKKSQQPNKTSDSETEKHKKKIFEMRKLRIPRKIIPQSEDSSDSEVETSRKKPPLKRKLLTPVNKIQSSKKNSDNNVEFLNCRKELHSSKNQSDTDSKTYIVNKIRCNICDERFTYPHVLRRHQQLMHKKRADYQCVECGEQFKRQDYLKNHERIVHLNNLFECRYCDKKYLYKHSKEMHEKKHKNEKLFQCPLSNCGKKFSCKYNFKKHKMMHRIKNLTAAGKSKYICDECDKMFSDKSELKIHVQKHLLI